jgi:uncharacterized protein YhaN
MKIQRLDLRAYGPFTDLVLDFEDDANFHVIYGPNEAGKSSALRALDALFFGIPHSTGDDFLHPYKKLRLGALLQHSDGSTLEFWRRKANLASLYAADDKTPLDPGALQRFLGSVDQSLFGTMFGLDRESLARGGQEILRGGGRLGQLLFAAGAGIADLKAVQDALERDYEELYLPAGKVKRINRALSDLRANREEMKGLQLSLEEWSKHDAALRQAQERRDQVQARIDTLRSQEQSLSRLRDALPMLHRRRELLAQRSPSPAAPLPDDFAPRRRELDRALHLAELQRDEHEHALARIDEQLRDISVSAEILEEQDAIELLQRRLGDYLRLQREIPEKELAHARCRSELIELEHQLKLDSEPRPAAPYQNSEELLALRHLADQHPRLHAHLDSARHVLARLEEQHDALEREWRELEPTGAANDLRPLLRRIAPTIAGEFERQRLVQQLEALEAACERTANTLFQASASRVPIKRVLDAVPGDEVLDRFQSEWDKLHERQQALDQQSRLNEQELRTVEGHLGDVSLGPDLPTANDLAEARKKRDEIWRILRETWLEKKKSDRTPAELVQTFAQRQEHADHLADRLWREAERVGRKMELLAQKQRLEEHGQVLIHHLVEVRARQESLENEWRRVWQALGVEAQAPASMRGWLQQHAELTRDLRRAAEMRTRLADLETQAMAARRELSAALAQHELNHSEDSLTRLAERAQEIADRQEEQARRRGELRRLRQANDEELELARRRFTQYQEEWCTWQAQWRPHMQTLGLPDDALPADAMARLNLWSQWSARSSQLHELEGWLQSCREQQRAFEDEAGVWMTRLGTIHGDNLDVPRVVEELYHRLKATRANHERRNTLARQRAELEQRKEAADAAARHARAGLDTLCLEVGADSIQALAALETRWSSDQQRSRELAQLEEQLHRLAGSSSLESFQALGDRVDGARLERELDEVAYQLAALTKESRELDQRIGSLRAELSRMNGGTQAVEAAQRGEMLAAQITHDVEQYVVLRLAEAILKESIESYRQKNEGTLMQRAGRLFQRLTVGSFEGLEIDADERGELVLYGVRAEDRTPIGAGAMSDGARDQLYLALRLASLETYLDKHEPMPIIIDDLLLHFDNDRALAALKALADLARRTQILFFTHHRHLVELVEKNLPRELVLLHRLQGKGASREAMVELF